MKANPGGEIASTEVVGRDVLIARLWRVLERQSIVLTAERRMGKTTIIKKMRAEAPKEKLPIYRDLESIHSLLEFVENVFHDVERYLGPLQRVASKTRAAISAFSGTEIKGLVKLPSIVAPHWKALLTTVLEDLVEHQERSVIFFWDELPMMLHNIKAREGEEAAQELLNTLRALRQTHGELRMVFTGSIGLHNVLSSLRRGGYANDATNDMDTIDVPPLSREDAQSLAHRLLLGEGIDTNEPFVLARAIAEAVDGMPFFIHRIVDGLAEKGESVPVALVDQMILGAMTDPQDRWHLRHYRERITTYYGRQEQPIALRVLDVLATSDQAVPQAELCDRTGSTEDAECLRDVLAQLHQDHYLVRDEQAGEYRFRFAIIRHWWKLDRGLKP